MTRIDASDRFVPRVSVQSQCAACNRKEPAGLWRGRVVHSVRDGDGCALRGEMFGCPNFDAECRHIGEPLGFYGFAWLPVKCRNGQWRWLRSIERHGDGTFTLGNRAF